METEICICAAIICNDGTIIRGHRHFNCRDSAMMMGKNPKVPADRQGFITSRNRFVDRKEGLKLQLAAGIKSVADGGYRQDLLFSEDLY